ncbi:MAG: glycosyltransferase family 2 protein [Casimicrobiaceae bacterium]
MRTRDEADRLRLTLASLGRQNPLPYEIVVVNDGSVDHTDDVLRSVSGVTPFTIVRNESARGRSAAANAGAAVARGDLLLFMDGDTLAGRSLVGLHANLHRRGDARLARGETFHLRCTRFYSDPERGVPFEWAAAHVAGMSADDRQRSLVTRRMVMDAFGEIVRRSMPGIYPGIGPARLAELERDALVRHPDCATLWAACSGHNVSVPRALFVETGGFDERLDMNEHRELAFRLDAMGVRLELVEGARSYHLTHRRGWRDPLADQDWYRIFCAAHRVASVRLLPLFWLSLMAGEAVPDAFRIPSLPALAEAAAPDSAFDERAALMWLASGSPAGRRGDAIAHDAPDVKPA